MSFKVCILHLVLSEVLLHQSNVWLLHYKWGNMTDQYEEIDMNRCRYQSITQQFLKRCLIKDDNNYMFQPIAVIIRFPSESMVVVLYRIGMVMSQWWDLNICDVCYMLLLRDMGGGGSVMCAILGCTAQVCLLAAVLCGSPTIVCPFLMSTAGGLCYPCEIPHVSNR
jgi:hypothetical protein